LGCGNFEILTGAGAGEIGAASAARQGRWRGFGCGNSVRSGTNDSLSSISRLTQLYELEKSFSSTLEIG